MIPSMRAVFSDAVNQVEAAVISLGQGGYLPSPWLGDETSAEVAAHYKLRAMDGPDSSHSALVAYHGELNRIYDTLRQMEADYLRNENQTADTFRLQA
jgi:hypothetical protein